MLNKVSKTMGLLCKLQKFLLRPSLITICKSFRRSHLDYGDIVYDQAYNVSFHQNTESIQYNAALAITGAIRGTSREKLYHEFGLESLVSRRCIVNFVAFIKCSRLSHLGTYSMLFQQPKESILQEIIIICLTTK